MMKNHREAFESCASNMSKHITRTYQQMSIGYVFHVVLIVSGQSSTTNIMGMLFKSETTFADSKQIRHKYINIIKLQAVRAPLRLSPPMFNERSLI